MTPLLTAMCFAALPIIYILYYRYLKKKALFTLARENGLLYTFKYEYFGRLHVYSSGLLGAHRVVKRVPAWMVEKWANEGLLYARHNSNYETRWFPSTTIGRKLDK
jgi:hypothetical protein